MKPSVHWSSLAVVLCLFCKGWEVHCDCTEDHLQIHGGYYTLSKNLESGTLLTYHCPEGFFPYPTITRRCQPNGHWTPQPNRFNQICKFVECPDPNVFENGNVFPLQRTHSAGQITRYECYPGFTLSGSSNRTCLSNGKWSGSTPICIRDTGDTCSDPGVPAGASRRGSIFAAGGTVTYSCNDNTYLVGSRERTCQENGRWTGREPACYSKFTYDTQSEVAEALLRSLADSLTFSQLEDDDQGGRKIRIKKEKLNIYIAVDVSDSIEKLIIKRTKQAIMTLVQKISNYLTPNYEILFFSTDVHEVVNIVDFHEGRKTLSSVLQDVERFELGDMSTGKDLNAALKKFEERVTTMKEQLQQEFSDTRHIFLIFTDGAYSMGGSPVPTFGRIKNMVYMSPTGEPGSRSKYLESYVFAIGDDIYEDDLLPLTVGPEGETHYFRLQKQTNLAVTFDEVIDDNSKNLCGLHKDYELEGDDDSKRKRYPWWAAVKIQTESRMALCSGSLVSSHFVLTAAHCFPSEFKPENVKVEIDDKKGGKEKTVRKVFLHPNYNIKARQEQGVTEFYDYDVALIQLEDSVQTSTLARPICIPCTQETNDVLKLPGISTCSQQEELLLKNQREKLNFLSADRVGVNEKVVHAKFGKSRDVCIQKALNALGMRITDPTVAVTDNFLCTGGDGDHIACAGDGGQAVFKIHQNRAVQIGVVSWGTELLCRGREMRKSTNNSRDFHINLFKVVSFLKSTLGNTNQDEYPTLTFLSD